MLSLRSMLIGLAALGALVAGCGGDTVTATTSPPTTLAAGQPSSTTITVAPTTTTTTSTTAPPTTTSPPSTTSSTTTTTIGAAGTIIEVLVSDGEVDGPGRPRVEVGTEVTVRVTADVTDEVHIHGYDVFADVAPDAPAEIMLTADIPGIFEVELESSGLLLFDLQVG